MPVEGLLLPFSPNTFSFYGAVVIAVSLEQQGSGLESTGGAVGAGESEDFNLSINVGHSILGRMFLILIVQ